MVVLFGGHTDSWKSDSRSSITSVLRTLPCTFFILSRPSSDSTKGKNAISEVLYMDNTNKRNRNKHARPTGAGVPLFHSLWLSVDVIDAHMTQDQYLASSKTQRSILSQITAIIHKLSTTPEPSDDRDVTNIDCSVSAPPPSRLKSFSIS